MGAPRKLASEQQRQEILFTNYSQLLANKNEGYKLGLTMDARSNELTANEAPCILDALPDPRRKTYLDIAAQHEILDTEIKVLAARLYIWNGDLASTVDRAVSEVEIQLRNCIDQACSEWNSKAPRNGSREWLLYPEGKLAEVTLKNGKPLACRSDTQTVSGEPLHDDYVAGLTFGQWVHLLPKPYAGENNARVILWGGRHCSLILILLILIG